MTEKKYIDYTVEDLLHDQEFVSTVKVIGNSDEWEHFLKLHIDSKDKILQAKKIIEVFDTTEGLLSPQQKQKLWENISKLKVTDNKTSKRVPFKIFARVAASILIILSLGIMLYLHFKPIEKQFQFSELNNDLKSENPRLVLSNGNTVELGETESKIIVLKGQDALQINNNQIVENQTTTDQTSGEPKFNEVIIPFGKKSKLVLEDGTIVWLNAGSRFAFPQKFKGVKREVFLDGEAYFEVAKDKQHPFIISTEDVNVEVLGTRFNLSAYKNDNFCETVLLEGSVNVSEKDKLIKERVLMVPNQKATYNKNMKNIVLEPEMEPEKYIVWVEGWYQFTNENLEQVLKKVERYYNIKFEYDQSIISGLLPISGKLDLKGSLDEVMMVLSRVAKFEYQILGNSIIIKHK